MSLEHSRQPCTACACAAAAPPRLSATAASRELRYSLAPARGMTAQRVSGAREESGRARAGCPPHLMRSEVGARRGGTYHRQDHDPTPASETHTRAGRSRDAAAAEHASDARHVRERANNLERASCQHDSGPRPHRALADDQPPCPSAAGAPPELGQLIDARQRRRYEGGGGARRRKPVAVGQSSLERARVSATKRLSMSVERARDFLILFGDLLIIFR